MTDKATVAIPSTVNGKVVSTTGKPGDMIPVGSELIVFEVDGAGSSDPEPEPKPETKGKQTKIVENIESVTDSKLSNVEQMEKLIQLRNNGGITPEEFKQMKKEILGK
jgi:pyruvate/2-oxoglutarate dehydrogenase complex dihydrolipoamide acyltransferase (E2) component